MHSGEHRNLNSHGFRVPFYIYNRKSRISSFTWAKIQSIWNVWKGVLRRLMPDPTNHARPLPPPPSFLITNRPTDRTTNPKPRPPGYRHGRGLEGGARTQIPLGAPCPTTTPTWLRLDGPYVPEGRGTAGVIWTLPGGSCSILQRKQ